MTCEVVKSSESSQHSDPVSTFTWESTADGVGITEVNWLNTDCRSLNFLPQSLCGGRFWDERLKVAQLSRYEACRT